MNNLSYETNQTRRFSPPFYRGVTACLLLACALLLAACNSKAEQPEATTKAEDKHDEHKAGAAREVELAPAALKAAGIEFAEVTKSGERLTMPYNALLYDPSGGEWAFASAEKNVYARTPLKVEAIEGDKVYLVKGPAVGTKLVTNGAAELYGIEFGVGK